MEEDLWRQRASVRWIKEGDRNTKFYQSWVKQKRARLRIHSILSGDQVVTEEKELKESASEFFQNLFAPTASDLMEPNLNLIQHHPNLPEWEGLASPPDEEEIRRAVWNISADSTPGPDGFTAAFYHSCWNIIRRDVVDAVVQFFNGAYLPRSFTATMIVLLPKKDNPESWSDFRPISLCNVSNKIITKILAARMAPLLPKVISPNQSGFVQGRLLNDNVLLAQELFHELHRSRPAPNVVLKIDMAKAYDRVQWPFLIKVMRRMGFPEAWLGLIERCIGSCWFSILINGAPAGFFKSTRGLRQGDPISPSLFIIAAEFLSCALDNTILGKKDMVFKSTKTSSEVSHLAYADDIVIFTQAAADPIRRVKACLDEYSMMSGQMINLSKSNFYITENNEEWASVIENEGGFTRGTFPFLYLGVPIYKGAKKTDMFLFLREKISRRISGWAHRHLSFGGRLTLIQSTLEAIPIHVFQAIEPTKGALQLLEQQIARFFWGSVEGKRRTHWIAWDQVCLPTTEGGLGIRRFEDVLKAFNVKLWWRFREQSSLWATHMQSKYCHSKSPLALSTSSRNSPTWRRLAAAWPLTQPHIRWILGNGKISFWDDIWLGDKPLRDVCIDTRGDPRIKVEDFWRNGQWDESKVNNVQHQTGIPYSVAERIVNTPISSESLDVPRWSLSRCGNFSLSSAWDSTRARRALIPALGDLWHEGLTTTISIFMWRLISNRVPVDKKLQWRKISLASKCHCCPTQPEIESLEHLFVHGQGADKVWRTFDDWFGGTTEPLRRSDSVPTRLEIWAKRINHSAKTHMARTIPCIIMWFLWAERNNCRHKGGRFRPFNVIWQVRYYLQKLVESGRVGSKHFKGIQTEGTFLPPPHPVPPRQRVMHIKWNPPEPLWVKLNTRGRIDLATNKAGGGGILRSHLGKPLAAFVVPLKAQIELEAELEAICLGMSLAARSGYSTWVETSSSQAKAIISSREWGPAACRHLMVKIKDMLKIGTFKISCVRREGNKVATSLAHLGNDAPQYQEIDFGSMPRLLKATIRLEQAGVPYVGLDEEEVEVEAP